MAVVGSGVLTPIELLHQFVKSLSLAIALVHVQKLPIIP